MINTGTNNLYINSHHLQTYYWRGRSKLL